MDTDFNFDRLAESFPLWIIMRNVTNSDGKPVRTEFFHVSSGLDRLLVVLTTEDLAKAVVKAAFFGCEARIESPIFMAKFLEQERFTHVTFNPIPSNPNRHKFTTDQVLAKLRESKDAKSA